MRLDAYLSQMTDYSRREAGQLIRSGQVTVDGQVIRVRNYSLTPGQTLSCPALTATYDPTPPLLYLLYHKPAGLVTACRDPKQPTILEAFPAPLIRQGLVPVGRLDKDTTGLLILTNEGQLHHRLLAPKWGVWKTYEVTYSGLPLEDRDVRAVAQGLPLSDGLTLPGRLQIFDYPRAQLTIHEGRFHQVKRMFLALHREVVTLHRIAFGPQTLGDLPCGQSRHLTPEEVAALYTSVSLTPPQG